MSYESPIEMIMGQMRTEVDGEIFKAVQDIGVNVDREELLKALRYDRGQYEKGYADRDAEIVRCRDCIYRTKRVCNRLEFYECEHLRYQQTKCGVTDDWFCADGRRMAENEERY